MTRFVSPQRFIRNYHYYVACLYQGRHQKKGSIFWTLSLGELWVSWKIHFDLRSGRFASKLDTSSSISCRFFFFTFFYFKGCYNRGFKYNTFILTSSISVSPCGQSLRIYVPSMLLSMFKQNHKTHKTKLRHSDKYKENIKTKIFYNSAIQAMQRILYLLHAF